MIFYRTPWPQWYFDAKGRKVCLGDTVMVHNGRCTPWAGTVHFISHTFVRVLRASDGRTCTVKPTRTSLKGHLPNADAD